MHDAQGAKLQAASDHTYLHGGYGEMLPALERALEGKAPGDSVMLQLEPEDAMRGLLHGLAPAGVIMAGSQTMLSAVAAPHQR